MSHLQDAISDSSDDDVLYIDEVVQLTPPENCNCNWKIKPKPKPIAESTTKTNQTSQNQKKRAPPPRRLTPQTKPTLTEPAMINGRLVTNLESLSYTTSLQELRMRQTNTYQKFRVRGNNDIYLDQTIINRIKFEEIQEKKGHEHTVNFPQRYQARLKVKANGDIIFHHYHRRNIRRIRNPNIEPMVQREGKMFEVERK